MKLLVVGGTLFLGRHLVASALDRGHTVTTFTRGRTNAGLRDDVEALHGDRDGDLTALRGREWDAVVDTCAYRPRQVEASASLLRDRVGLYCLISTASVYASFPAGGADEATATLDATDHDVSYGSLKVGCERALSDAFGERLLIARPGVLCGPHDPTGRLGYWVQRIARGGDVLTPGDPDRALQLLDARDLARWLIVILERQSFGVYNASGPERDFTVEEVFATCRTVTESSARFVWAGDDFLLSRSVTPWSDLPFWLPADADLPLLDSRKARGAGLVCRPLRDTIRDIMGESVDIVRADGGPPRPLPLTYAREGELPSQLTTSA